MLEIGDMVREIGDTDVRKIVGIGPGEFFKTEIGGDAATVKMVKGDDLELVAKFKKPDTGLAFVPDKSIMDVGY